MLFMNLTRVVRRQTSWLRRFVTSMVALIGAMCAGLGLTMPTVNRLAIVVWLLVNLAWMLAAMFVYEVLMWRWAPRLYLHRLDASLTVVALAAVSGGLLLEAIRDDWAEAFGRNFAQPVILLAIGFGLLMLRLFVAASNGLAEAADQEHGPGPAQP